MTGGAPRRGTVLRVTLAYVLVSLALLNAASWYAYSRTVHHTRELEDALGRRLLDTALGIARRLDGFHLSVLRPGDESHVFFQQTQRWIEDECFDHGDEAIVIVGPDRKLRVSSRERARIGDPFDAGGIPSPILAAALAGRPDVAPVTVVGDTWHKAACAPVLDPERRVVAAVVVRASAEALSPLRQTRKELLRLAIGIAGASVIAAAVLSTVLLVTLRNLLRGEEAARRAEHLAMAGTLSASVAHEVRNPLGVISGMAELLLERAAPGTREHALAGDILGEVERLNRVVTGFLDFARPSPPEPRRVEVEALVARTVSLLQASLARRKIEVVTDVPPGLAPVVADAGRIEQVLLNLVLNARDAMPGGGTLTLQARPAGRRVELSITDTGSGIAPSVRARLTEPFFTTKERGTGLGLAVVRRIVEEHGGRLLIASAEGRGTSFSFTLPAATGDSA